jgi:hypothetical protein
VVPTDIPTCPPLLGRDSRYEPPSINRPANRAPQTASRQSAQTVSIDPGVFYLGKPRIHLRGKIA